MCVCENMQVYMCILTLNTHTHIHLCILVLFIKKKNTEPLLYIFYSLV